LENDAMKQLTKFLPLILTLTGTVGAAIFTPSFVATHPVAFLLLNALSQTLHAALPSIFGGPQGGGGIVQIK
jgi:hypothetical protein